MTAGLETLFSQYKHHQMARALLDYKNEQLSNPNHYHKVARVGNPSKVSARA
jgi:hypothetical protein